MKITKRQLKRIIKEEKSKLYNNFDFGSNEQRKNLIKEWGPGGPGDRGLEPLPSGPNTLEQTVDSHLNYLQYWLDSYESFDDPRALDIEDLLQQLYERMMAVKENRE
tara:strand:- start:729 stop:1049 length:321 start_codon:yes stop_codon:yes gene_type:complete